jgi:DNA polymerase
MLLWRAMGHVASKDEQLRKIRDEVLQLTTSPLYAYRVENKYFPVIGEGNHDAAVMFIGEAPGKNEALTGRPFCGAAGKLLDELLATIAVPRSEVYIANILKDRPPSNRDPLPEEIAVYAPFLDRQIEIIKPSVIATLGRFSMEYIMRKFGLGSELQPISKIHGKLFSLGSLFGSLTIVPLYHPAAAIYTRSLFEELKKDFQVLKQFI